MVRVVPVLLVGEGIVAKAPLGGSYYSRERETVAYAQRSAAQNGESAPFVSSQVQPGSSRNSTTCTYSSIRRVRHDQNYSSTNALVAKNNPV